VFGQCQRCGGGGDIAANDLNVREVVLDPLHAVQYALAVAVGGVDHDHIHTRFSQQRHTLFRAFAGANGSADTQATLLIFGGVRVFGFFDDVLDGDEAAQVEGIVHHQHAFQPVLVHQAAGFVDGSAFLDGDQLGFRRHDVGHLGVQARLEAQIAVGDDADQLAVIDHRQAGNFVLTG